MVNESVQRPFTPRPAAATVGRYPGVRLPRSRRAARRRDPGVSEGQPAESEHLAKRGGGPRRFVFRSGDAAAANRFAEGVATRKYRARKLFVPSDV